MSTKDALENRKKVIETKENKDPELKEPTNEIKEVPKGADNLPAVTNEQLHNMAKNLYATMKVVALHQQMHNEHYKTHKEHEDKIVEHGNNHELTHNVLAKMIDEKTNTQE